MSYTHEEMKALDLIDEGLRILSEQGSEDVDRWVKSLGQRDRELMQQNLEMFARSLSRVAHAAAPKS